MKAKSDNGDTIEIIEHRLIVETVIEVNGKQEVFSDVRLFDPKTFADTPKSSMNKILRGMSEMFVTVSDKIMERAMTVLERGAEDEEG